MSKKAKLAKKLKGTPSALKLMVTMFWDSKGILFIEYSEKGRSITTSSYANTLLNLKEAIKRKSVDNRPHVCCSSTLQPPNLAPSDYLLFLILKKIFVESVFSDDEDLKAAIYAQFSDKEDKYF